MWPDKSFAFGPAAHIELALKILAEGPGCFKNLTGALGLAFIYGNLVPDFFIAPPRWKRLYHSFEAFEHLLLKAKKPCEHAFALGYGTHLLADKVAHEKIIPAFARRLDLPPRLIHYYFEWTIERNLSRNLFLLKGLYLWPGHRRLNLFVSSSFEIERHVMLTRKLITLSSMRLAKIRRRTPPNSLVKLFERRFLAALPSCLSEMQYVFHAKGANNAYRGLGCA
ncbi:zinc dependent phospholipase C family protein [Thermodesulfatator atlanticus]|uniref:zinc dependent phospholipase C family protein n=1 Tax=Thermodesulfatator atlanticus TaxID=501497 RepID=UPI00146DC7D4|nr:zinc dependent phospholipase C family protein [Thermodesulfatator atlanticus]